MWSVLLTGPFFFSLSLYDGQSIHGRLLFFLWKTSGGLSLKTHIHTRGWVGVQGGKILPSLGSAGPPIFSPQPWVKNKPSDMLDETYGVRSTAPKYISIRTRILLLVVVVVVVS